MMSSFEKGDTVIFRSRGAGCWNIGKVIKRCDDDLYKVQKLYGAREIQVGRCVIAGELDRTIYSAKQVRRVPEYRNGIQEEDYDSMIKLRHDPNAFLYDENIQQEKDHIVGIAKDDNDALQAFCKEMSLDPDTVKRKSQKLMPMTYRDLHMCFVNFHNRRPVSTQCLDHFLESIVEQQESQNNNDPHSMLQLADATRYGFNGRQKHFCMAKNRYLCAAWGCSEQELIKSFSRVDSTAFPLGTPEAMTATAILFYDEFVRNQTTKKTKDNVFYQHDFHSLIRHAIKDKDNEAIKTVYWMAFFLGHASRRGWDSPFHRPFAEALRDENVVQSFNPHSGHVTSKLSWGGYLRPTVTIVPNSNVDKFANKATEIFSNLPCPEGVVMLTYRHPPPMAPKMPNSWHVEYREFPLSRKKYALVVKPDSIDIGIITIKQEYQDCLTTSQEAMHHVWTKLAFYFHMGVGMNRRRIRPTIMTFLKNPNSGDEQIAIYIQNQLQNHNNNDDGVTKLQMVEPHLEANILFARFVDELERFHLDVIKRAILDDDHQAEVDQGTIICLQPHIPIGNYHDKKSAQQMINLVTEIKDQGIAYFERDLFLPAKQCYTEAIVKLQALLITLTNVENVIKLIAILLNGRAQCYLNLAMENDNYNDIMNVKSAMAFAKNAMEDCETVLQDRRANTLDPELREEVESCAADAKDLHEQLLTHIPAQVPAAATAAPQPADGGGSSSKAKKKSKNRKGKNRRQRQRRLKEERQKQRQLNNEEDPAANNNHEEEVDDLPDNMFVQLGKDLVDTGLASNVTTKEDVCPVCNERFQVELENDRAVVLACRHACCLPCLADLTRSSDRQKNALSYVCPICRYPIESECLGQFASHVAKTTQTIRDRLFGLRLRWNERWAVAERLIVSHRFVISDVLASLDAMTLDNLQSSLWRLEDLSHEEKQHIYEQARRPVDALRNELHQMRTQLGQFRDRESDEYIQGLETIRELEERIAVANKNAQDEIYSRVNCADSMGRELNSGEIQIDFHGLHVEEAKVKFDELALQILPVTGTILLIVGRGLHSEGGMAKLKQALKLHLKEHPKRENLRWEELAQNEGILRVKWK